MKFENTRVFNFEGAFRGMRNPLESWNKSDSVFGIVSDITKLPDLESIRILYEDKNTGCIEFASLGENDLNLARRLIRAGSPDRKFMRQISVSVDITAPEYFYNELDTYKVGTVGNSTSKMHKLSNTEITFNRFEIDDFNDLKILLPGDMYETSISKEWKRDIDVLEQLRKKYNETKDKRYWKELIRKLPDSWLQTRTFTCNYENLYSMCKQRGFHKLNEWSGIDDPSLVNFLSWVGDLPYAQELIFSDEIEKMTHLK